jgi:hypothetical protein
MLHNLRHEPLPDYLKRKLQRLRKRRSVTLCIAAPCFIRNDLGKYQMRVVYGWDKREENQFAGSDIAFKAGWANQYLMALQAGEGSAPEDFLATCKSCLPKEVDFINAFDALNAVVGVHKNNLCQRRSQEKFGIDYERLLTKGQEEIPLEARERFFYDLEKLDPGFEVIIFGFSRELPLVFVVDGYDVQSCSETFATIGSGAVIAETVLYQRKQEVGLHLDHTLYNVYEAFKLATGAAPGVGAEFAMGIASPSNNEKRMEHQFINDEGKKVLEDAFQKFGPRIIDSPPTLKEGHFQV